MRLSRLEMYREERKLKFTILHLRRGGTGWFEWGREELNPKAKYTQTSAGRVLPKWKVTALLVSRRSLDR